MKSYLSVILLFLFSSSLSSQNMTKEQYVNKYYKMAIREMNLFKIPASITLAQGILETNNGNSDLAIKANNHFGIKCQNSWTGMKYIKDDDTKNECFRVYANAEESYRDHSEFLLRPRYEKLFTYDLNDYKSWAYGLKAAGYATNPNYPQILIKYIEELRLYEFDNFGWNATEVKKDTPVKTTIKAIDTTPKATSIDTAKTAPKNTRKQIANNLNFIVIDSTFNIDLVAKETKISKSNLLLYNDLQNEQPITLGQNFFLERKLKDNKLAIHEVRKGESLYDISQRYGMTLESLKNLNKIEQWEQPQEGEVLTLFSTRTTFLKTRSYMELQMEKMKLSAKQKELDDKISTFNTSIQNPTKETPAVTVNKSKTIIHTVTNKETIFRIAKNYGCKPYEIYEWNNLKVDEGIKPGQELKIIINK